MSAYNADELIAPPWLNKEFLQDILRNFEKKNDLEITNLTITPATLKGDHFASVMFRATIEYTRSTIESTNIATRNLIIKTLPEKGSMKGDILSDLYIFETEIGIYTKALPKIEEVLREHGDDTNFGPKVIYSSLEPHKIVILEDLCELGYGAVRGRSVTMQEVKAVFSKLAKFHAVSYKLSKSEEAEVVTQFRHGFFNSFKAFEIDLFSGCIERLRRVLKSVEELRAFLPYFQGVDEDIKKDCLELYTAFKDEMEEEIFVLNHGDFHTKNLMCKFDKENRFEDVMMVDFQMSVYGPPMTDLNYAIYTMLSSEQRLEKRDEIKRFYFESFIATLKKIDYQGKLPTFAQLQMSNLKRRRSSLLLMASVLPFALFGRYAKAEDMAGLEFSDVFNSNDYLMKCYFNPRYIEELKRLLPLLLNRGYLD